MAHDVVYAVAVGTPRNVPDGVLLFLVKHQGDASASDPRSCGPYGSPNIWVRPDCRQTAGVALLINGLHGMGAMAVDAGKVRVGIDYALVHAFKTVTHLAGL